MLVLGGIKNTQHIRRKYGNVKVNITCLLLLTTRIYINHCLKGHEFDTCISRACVIIYSSLEQSSTCTTKCTKHAQHIAQHMCSTHTSMHDNVDETLCTIEALP